MRPPLTPRLRSWPCLLAWGLAAALVCCAGRAAGAAGAPLRRLGQWVMPPLPERPLDMGAIAAGAQVVAQQCLVKIEDLTGDCAGGLLCSEPPWAELAYLRPPCSPVGVSARAVPLPCFRPQAAVFHAPACSVPGSCFYGILAWLGRHADDPRAVCCAGRTGGRRPASRQVRLRPALACTLHYPQALVSGSTAAALLIAPIPPALPLLCRCCERAAVVTQSGCLCDSALVPLVHELLTQQGTTEFGWVLGALSILDAACGAPAPNCTLAPDGGGQARLAPSGGSPP